MAKQPGRGNRNTSFGKRQGADDDFRKKKKEGGPSSERSGRGEYKGRPRTGDGDSKRPRTGGSSYGRSEGTGRTYGRSAGTGRSEGPRSSSSGRSYGRGTGRSEGREEGGERKSFRGSSYEGGKRKFSDRSDDKKPFRSSRPTGSSRPSFGDRDESRGEKKSFGEKRSYGPKKPFGERKSYGDKKSFGDKKPFGDKRSYGDKKPYGDKKSFGDQKPFGEKRSYGAKKSFDGDDKKPFRKEKRERKSFVESKVQSHRERVERPEGEEQNVPMQEQQAGGDELIRLNKFISNSGVCSRREADELIKMGLITVNGVTITEMGHKVKSSDDVRHEGKKLTAERPVYILLNKPKGFITTTDDPQERNTVMQLIAGACKERVYPVGRLDRNTTGLLLLTNDGDLTDKLTHPSFNAKKIYKVELDKPLTKADFQKIVDGVHLEEGRAIVDDLAIVSDDNITVGIELHIGWNHVVRRIFNALEYDVVKLDRVVYAGLDKKELKRGQWRFLKTDEIVRLKHFK